jgi:hypothetical protein
MPDIFNQPLLQLGADVSDLLRHHNLLMPLLQAVVVEEATAAVQLSEEECQKLLQQWLGARPLEEAQRQTWEQLGWRPEDLQRQVLQPARLRLLAQEHFAAKAEARFLKRKGQLDQVVYSLVHYQDGGLARELYMRLATGEANFQAVAVEYSDGPERMSAGVIGPKPLSSAHPLLAERLRTARDGEVLEPFAVENWWLVVRRDQYQPAQFDAAMAERMTQELLQEWLLEGARAQLALLNAAAPTPPSIASTSPSP